MNAVPHELHLAEGEAAPVDPIRAAYDHACAAAQDRRVHPSEVAERLHVLGALLFPKPEPLTADQAAKEAIASVTKRSTPSKAVVDSQLSSTDDVAVKPAVSPSSSDASQSSAPPRSNADVAAEGAGQLDPLPCIPTRYAIARASMAPFFIRGHGYEAVKCTDDKALSIRDALGDVITISASDFDLLPSGWHWDYARGPAGAVYYGAKGAIGCPRVDVIPGKRGPVWQVRDADEPAPSMLQGMTAVLGLETDNSCDHDSCHRAALERYHAQQSAPAKSEGRLATGYDQAPPPTGGNTAITGSANPPDGAPVIAGSSFPRRVIAKADVSGSSDRRIAFVTKGNRYDVLAQTENLYQVKCDDGQARFHSKGLFIESRDASPFQPSMHDAAVRAENSLSQCILSGCDNLRAPDSIRCRRHAIDVHQQAAKVAHEIESEPSVRELDARLRVLEARVDSAVRALRGGK